MQGMENAKFVALFHFFTMNLTAWFISVSRGWLVVRFIYHEFGLLFNFISCLVGYMWSNTGVYKFSTDVGAISELLAPEGWQKASSNSEDHWLGGLGFAHPWSK